MEITKNSIIGDVLDQYPDTAELFLAVLHHEVKQLKRLVWYTVQMQTHSLQTLIKQLHNERRI